MIDNSDSLVFMIKIFFLWKHEHEAKAFWHYCYSNPVPFMQLVYYKSERVLQTWSCYESWKKKQSLRLILFSFKFWMTEKNSMSLNGESIKCNIYAKLAEHKANQTCSSWLTTSWQEQVYNMFMLLFPLGVSEFWPTIRDALSSNRPTYLSLEV